MSNDHLTTQDILDITHPKMMEIAERLIKEIENFATEKGDCPRCQANIASTLALDVMRAMALLMFSYVPKQEETAVETAGTLTTLMMHQIETAASRIFLSSNPPSKLH